MSSAAIAAADPELPAYAVRRMPALAPAERGAGQRRHSSEELLEAIRRWAALYGEPPTVADWDPTRARREGKAWRAERYEQGDWPTARMLRTAFGTMTRAVAAAGLAPRPAPARVGTHLRAPEEILEAIRAWTARYGEPPTMADWDPSRARSAGHLWRVRRYRAGDWPSARTVCHHYGNFGQAVTAAGLEKRPHGRQSEGGAEWRRGNLRALATPSGPGPARGEDLAVRVRAVAQARRGGDPVVLRLALVALANTALEWADALHEDEQDQPADEAVRRAPQLASGA